MATKLSATWGCLIAVLFLTGDAFQRPSAFPLLHGLTNSPLLLQSTTSSIVASDQDVEQKGGFSYTVTTDDMAGPAYPQQPPHAGRHFRPSHPTYADRKRTWWPRRRPPNRLYTSKRFFEGWYYRLTLLDDERTSFAFIFSIEDPGRSDCDDYKLAAMQVMGPNDEYLVQADPDDTKFWAWQHKQGLGCTFEYNSEKDVEQYKNRTALDPEEWNSVVKSGFQMLPTRLQGKLVGHDGTLGGVQPGQGINDTCTFDLAIRPVAGWGDAERQTSTAGWLASFSIFEPHWQVTLADARATGTVIWKGRQYNVTEEAPFYAEKNWGGAFPSKWYWVQCNAFEGYDKTYLSVTAGGGRRKIPWFGNGQTEDLGMVSIHYNGTFYEIVPWTGDMSWDVDPWGRWVLQGRSTAAGSNKQVEATLVAKCPAPGVVLRAPTETEGLEYFCRDSFLATLELSLWELEYDKEEKEYRRGKCILDRVQSQRGAVEIGGGPWWSPWKGTSKMKRPIRFLVHFPYRVRHWKSKVAQFVRRKTNK